MKSVRKLLLGALTVILLCCSLLATAPWNALPAWLPEGTIPLGVAHITEDISDGNTIPLGVAHLTEDT